MKTILKEYDLKNEFRIALYNLDIPLEERLKSIIIYTSIRSASTKLNMSYQKIKLIISKKKRVYIESLKGNYAIRHIK